jgi:hypothetical protein
MQEFHFFDLDWTLWKSDTKLSIINKKEPNKVIRRVESFLEPMMKTYWKKYDLPIRYNGSQWWLSKDIWEELQRKYKGIKLEDLGISYRDWTSEEILSKQKDKTVYLLSNLNHLKEKWNITINFLTARSNKEAHKDMLDDLKKSVYRKLRININKIYFVNDFEAELSDDNTASRKAKILLEHLIGYKIRKNRFVELQQTETESVHFYDDTKLNIEAAQSLQILFDSCIQNTDPVLKKEIIDRIKSNELKFTTHLITNNDIEPFKTTTHKLISPNDIKIFN